MYDAIVIGGGPAGGQFARTLTARRWNVLLVERCFDFNENNFSSAGTIFETLVEFIPR